MTSGVAVVTRARAGGFYSLPTSLRAPFFARAFAFRSVLLLVAATWRMVKTALSCVEFHEVICHVLRYFGGSGFLTSVSRPSQRAQSRPPVSAHLGIKKLC